MKRLIRIADLTPHNMQIPKVLFHATYGYYLESIKQKGLTINNPSNWKGMRDSNAVYLATDSDTAEDFAETAEVNDDVYDSGIYVLSIDTSQLDINKFGKDLNMMDLDDGYEPATIAYYGNIPVSAITF